jgi:ABC-type transporter Mla subunit MlaD
MTRISHFKIGVFFITSVVLLTIGLFWIGAQDYFQSSSSYVAYFDSTVKGLEAGSSVKYMGLDVGRVESLQLASGTGQEMIQVVMSLDSELQVEEDMAVRRELKAVTGQCELSIVRVQDEGQKHTPDIDFAPPHQIIPTVPGRIEKVEQALVHLYRRVESLDVSGLVQEWTAAARTARQTLDRKQIDSALKSMEKAFTDVSQVSKGLEKATASLTEGHLDVALQNLAASSRSMRRITGSMEQSLSELEPEALSKTLQNMNQTLNTVDSSVQSAQTRIDESLRHFQQGMIRLNQVLSEIQALARTLRTEPGRILNRPGTREPFQE